MFEQRFPADYICEAIDQTRGWFYSLIAISTLLFDRSPYKTVLCLGHIADPEGKKMSKSLGNIVVPWEVIDRHGADAFRWYFLTSKQPWDGYLFSTETVGESVRQFLLQLWNTYGFYVLYANVNDVEPSRRAARRPTSTAGRCRGSHATVAEVARAPRRLRRHARRPRDRRLRRRSLELVRAPLAPALLGRRPGRVRDAAHLPASRSRSCSRRSRPFIADEIYDNLDGAEPSVHLCDWPEAGERDEALEFAMGVARETVRLGLAARGQAKLKVRQPLRAAVVVAAGARARGDRAPRRRRARGAQRQGAALRRAGRRARLLRGQAQLPRARPALRQADAAGRGGGRRARPGARRRARCATAAASAISVDGHDHELGARRPAARDAAARGLPARARGLARGGARARARRRAAPRGARARDRPRGPERAQGRRPARSRTGSSWRSAATTSCSPPRASTRTTSAGETLARDASATTPTATATAATIEGRELRIAAGPRLGAARRAPARARPRGASWASRPGCAWPPGRCGTGSCVGIARIW